ncbi:hypothetical protein CEXT_800951 [Caerostris extrusa]|uniref:Uncharacterized protein n=1 Tax=Caerostris extrusa TaxID=172846 RepID=A0AAV4XCZ2_CAEEX|nr:hypothetical protein CEXT_800951 [Caerostris extrusa]
MVSNPNSLNVLQFPVQERKVGRIYFARPEPTAVSSSTSSSEATRCLPSYNFIIRNCRKKSFTRFQNKTLPKKLIACENTIWKCIFFSEVDFWHPLHAVPFESFVKD